MLVERSTIYLIVLVATPIRPTFPICAGCCECFFVIFAIALVLGKRGLPGGEIKIKDNLYTNKKTHTSECFCRVPR